MSDANVVKLVQPGSFADPLTEVLRNGARAAGHSHRPSRLALTSQRLAFESPHRFLILP